MLFRSIKVMLVINLDKSYVNSITTYHINNYEKAIKKNVISITIILVFDKNVLQLIMWPVIKEK